MTDDPNADLIVTTWTFPEGVTVAATINPEGGSDFWWLTPGASEGTWLIPPHEETGPLPVAVRRRIAAVDADREASA